MDLVSGKKILARHKLDGFRFRRNGLVPGQKRNDQVDAFVR